MAETKHAPEIEITDLMYCAYGTDTGILFGIPVDLRGSVEAIVKIAIRDYEEAAPEQQAKIDRFKDELKANINAMSAASAKIDRLEAEKREDDIAYEILKAEKAELRKAMIEAVTILGHDYCEFSRMDGAVKTLQTALAAPTKTEPK